MLRHGAGMSSLISLRILHMWHVQTVNSIIRRHKQSISRFYTNRRQNHFLGVIIQDFAGACLLLHCIKSM